MESFLYAEMQSMYSAASADWASFTLWVSRNDKVHYSKDSLFLFLLLIITRSGRLAEIR